MARALPVETIMTSSPDSARSAVGDEEIEWATRLWGTADMAAAYRQLPNRPDEEQGVFFGPRRSGCPLCSAPRTPLWVVQGSAEFQQSAMCCDCIPPESSLLMEHLFV